MHQLNYKQKLPVSLEKAWDFFSSPKNLKIITPPYMGFDIKSDVSEKMYEGMVISYIVRPLLNIPVKWVSKITKVEEPFMFIDEQLKGPYKIWEHKHKFKEIEGGIEAEDIIDYKLKPVFISKLVNIITVRKRLEEIFDFRRNKLEEMFGKY
jgi:ligand-binding SRPBCC domain-containing protein